MAKKQTKEDYGAMIRERHERWNYLSEHGCSDPNWSDGVNMNLVRNHIIYYKRRCEEELTPAEYPPEYYWGVPEEVHRYYMVNADEIRKLARKSFEVLLEDPDYKWLKKIDPEQLEKGSKHLLNPVHWMTGFANAIKDDKLVEMRRVTDTERYQGAFRESRKKIEAIIGQERKLPMGQLSIFDFI